MMQLEKYANAGIVVYLPCLQSKGALTRENVLAFSLAIKQVT
jgi:hypothetical protein